MARHLADLELPTISFCVCYLLALLVAYAASYPFETTSANTEYAVGQILELAEEEQYPTEEDNKLMQDTATKSRNHGPEGYTSIKDVCIVRLKGTPRIVPDGERTCFTRFAEPSTELKLHNIIHLPLEPGRPVELNCCRVCDKSGWMPEQCVLSS